MARAVLTSPALLMAMVGLTVMPSVAHGSGLSIKPTTAPAEASSSDLLGVSCASQASCIAVGNAERTGESGGDKQLGAFAELWNGTSWTVMTAPSSAQSSLVGVSCPSATSCVAVGQADARPLAEHWDGTAWTVLKTARLPGPHYGTLQAISCVSEDTCVAAGYYQALHEQAAAAPGALVEQWNGARWTLQHANPRPISSDSTLSGISCTSGSSCVAVGAFWPEEGNGYPGKPLAERWNGRSWAITASATVPRAGGELQGVSCTSATSCTAVGQLNPGAYPQPHNRLRIPWKSGLLVEHWNGIRWATEPAQQPGSANRGAEPILNGVSCLSPEFCTAVGDRASGAVPAALAEG